MHKRDLSESDIKAKFITPAILNSGWDEQTQIGREIFFTNGRIYVKGQLTARGKRKFADYILLCVFRIKWFFFNFGGYDGDNTSLLSKRFNDERPYICLLIVLSLFTLPSTGPLLHV